MQTQQLSMASNLTPNKHISWEQLTQLGQFVLWALLFLAAAGFEQQAQANERPNSAQQNTKAGLYLADNSALHLQSQAQVRIQAMAASVTLKQSFKNTSTEALHGEYILPLPEDAAVSALTIRIGEREIKARVKTKPEARRIYRQAQQQGKKAALIEQDRENLFRQKIANIDAGETIEIEVQWQQKIEYLAGTFSWRLPMTLTPRYQPTSTTDSNMIDQRLDAEFNYLNNPAANLFSNLPQQNNDHWQNQLQLNIELDAGFQLKNIQSLFNPINVELIGQQAAQRQYRIKPKQGAIAMEQDFVLQWQAADQSNVQFSSFLQQNYFLGMLTPKLSALNSHTLERDSLFIIDVSGSMAGTSIKQAKAALSLAIEELEADDKFNIIRFNQTSEALFKQSQNASPAIKKQALAYINQLKADGGTEMMPALKLAQELSAIEDDNFVSQVFFITDGSISNEQALLDLIQQKFKHQRIFTIAIGSAPNHFFMRKAAQFGQGTSLVINDIKQVYQSMQTLFKQLKTPLLTQLELSLIDDNGDEVEAEVYPQQLPDLYSGQPLSFSAKLADKQKASKVILRANYGGEDIVFEQALSANEELNLALSQIWARAKIEDLNDLKYQARRDPQQQQAIVQSITATALEHQLVSAYTSLVAVEEMPQSYTFANKTAAVKNLKPKGQTLAMPTTATLKDLYYMIALALLVLALAAWGLSPKLAQQSKVAA